ncbi:MAG: hypothetical protein ACRD1R_02850 [Acidobacteriota bacterium]
MTRNQVSFWVAGLIVSVLFLAESTLVPLAADDFPFHFTDATAEAGIEFVHENGASPKKLLIETFGSGLGWIDFDGDGWLDLYLVNGANLAEGESSPGNVLYRNLGV